eukprot:GHVS01095455.1.p1 GENE.GHVS01095455.1~~GHVS01095455.1.p1  ORF type:complete len:269 (+),score=30.59 GHVS01095455.1:155-961(+)
MCYSLSNEDDSGKGRQMPVHYGSRELNIATISSTVAPQITHAVGAGYAFKNNKEDKVAVVFFGDGGSSTGDFAVGVNFAVSLGSQTLFICRNNGFAISTPVAEQYRGDGVACRAVACGVDTIRVDGNDLVAVMNAVTEARKLCVTGRPVFIELMTYRIGHHSTSDDASRYRGKGKKVMGLNPINRMMSYLENQGAFTEHEQSSFIAATRKHVLERLREAERRKSCAILPGLFDDVYFDEPLHLREQRASLADFLGRNAHRYDLSKFKT